MQLTARPHSRVGRASNNQRGKHHRRALALATAAGAVVLVLLVAPHHAIAEDRIDFTTTSYTEQRRGGLGGLVVVHPQLSVGIDIGESTTINASYSADAVSGATAAVYAVDAVSSATTFDDLRHEGSLGLSFRGSRSTLSVTVATGLESDYTSLSVSGGGSIDLPGKNTNLALSYTHNFDNVCDRDNAMLTPLERLPLDRSEDCKSTFITVDDTPGLTVWRDLSIDTTQATLTQNLSPTVIMQVGLFGQVLSGFQSNPYRRVKIGDLLPQEAVPDVRARGALMTRFNIFFPPARGAIHFSARGYSDTWGVDSVTGEMGYSQYLGSSLLVRLRARFYQQNAATFYKDAYFYETQSTAGAYLTGDRELGRVRNLLGSAKMSYIKVAEDDGQIWGLFDRLQLNLKGEFLWLAHLAVGSESENPFDISDQYLSSGPAFVAQLGLILAY